jgi:TolB protein
MSGHFTVLDPAAFDASPVGTSPSTAKLSSLAGLGANLVIAGAWQQQGQQLSLDLKLIDPGSGAMLLGKRYRGGPNDGRRMMTQFVNDVVTYLTGEKGIPQGRIAFISGSTDRKELYLMDLGGAAKPLTRLGTITLTPSWSPDGQEIFFCSYRGGFPAIYAVNPSSGGVRKLTSHGTLNVTPGAGPGGLLAVTLNKDNDQEIYLLDRQGNVKQRLTQSPGVDISPSFSPDGQQIAFVSSRGGNPQIFVMPVSGGQPRRLTFSGAYNVSPAWSPRGDLIAYASRTGSGFQIFVISPQGGSPRQVTQEGNNESPTWSPDGAFIAYSSTRGGQSAIYVANVKTGAATRVTNMAGNQTQPAWAPR